ncbi:hypothetical protein VTL71DRAFT_8628 [Oculimacula yallundae]|uniref:Uncharacterized protein n=1 Tax=Oculimacula yallundae TaxID=86028 RepID=A0ABR4CY62_9HELO
MPRAGSKHPSLPRGTVAEVNSPWFAEIEETVQSYPNMTFTQLRKELRRKKLLTGLVPNTPSWLLRLPFEVRDMIFAYCVDIVDCRSPPLLIALRGDTELYLQCLEHYYELNYYTLNTKTLPYVNDLSPKALSRMKRLCIEIKYSDLYGEMIALDKILPLRLWEATNVTTLMFRIPLGISGTHDHWVRNTLIIFPGITKVIFDGDTLPTRFDRAITPCNSVINLNIRLGMLGRNIEEWYNGEIACCILWAAQPWDVLVWEPGPMNSHVFERANPVNVFG